MFIEPTIISVIIAKLRGGKFKKLENVHIKGWFLLILAGGIQITLSILNGRNTSFANMIIEDYFIYFYALSYILLILAILLNISKSYMKIFLFGIILNCIVIFSNGGKMPVAVDGIKGADNASIELKASDIKHEPMTENTKMSFLGDIIRIPPPYPLAKILSIGDVFLMCGVFVFFQKSMTDKSRQPMKVIKIIREPLK